MLCPMSDRLLKMKDLIDITFTAIKDGDSKKAVIVKDVCIMKTYSGFLQKSDNKIP